MKDRTKTELIESVFPGDGEMGARMRSRLVDDGSGPSGAVAEIAACLRAHRAGLCASDAHFLGA
jgi:hypothetical protein